MDCLLNTKTQERWNLIKICCCTFFLYFLNDFLIVTFEIFFCFFFWGLTKIKLTQLDFELSTIIRIFLVFALINQFMVFPILYVLPTPSSFPISTESLWKRVRLMSLICLLSVCLYLMLFFDWKIFPKNILQRTTASLVSTR